MRTIKEILGLFPDTKKNEWGQYANCNGDDGGWVHSSARIYYPQSVYVGDNAILRGGTFYGGVFYGGTFYRGEFRRGVFSNSDAIWHDSPPQLTGRRWSTHQANVDTVRCGCEEHTFDEWKDAEFMEKTFNKNWLTPQEKEEYKASILFCIEMAKFVKVTRGEI